MCEKRDVSSHRSDCCRIHDLHVLCSQKHLFVLDHRARGEEETLMSSFIMSSITVSDSFILFQCRRCMCFLGWVGGVGGVGGGPPWEWGLSKTRVVRYAKSSSPS